MLYCSVLAIKDTIKIFFKYPQGMGNHQIKIEAANIKRKPINNIGGKDSKAGFAITKPKPKNIGTKDATKVSFIFISLFLILMIIKKLMIYSLF